jgi:membrane-associated phospholipid phosphatase
LGTGLTGAALVLGSAVLDKRADRFAANHAQAGWSKFAIKSGNAIPWIGLGAAALAALDGSDPRRSGTGYAAAEAGTTAFLAATALKYAFGRARPDTGLGRGDFKPFTADNRHNAFPSRHTAVAWAVLTPMAEEYGAEWLYGVAALANVARVGSREHWVSDTVAGSLIGYGVGRLFWESARRKGGGPALVLERSGAKLAWDW